MPLITRPVWCSTWHRASACARVDPLLLGKVMEVLTPQELGDLVNAIVDAVEHPDAQPLCHRPDDTV